MLHKWNSRLWWFGDSVVSLGWKFYNANHFTIARRLFHVGYAIEGIAEGLYR